MHYLKGQKEFRNDVWLHGNRIDPLDVMENLFGIHDSEWHRNYIWILGIFKTPNFRCIYNRCEFWTF